MNNITKNLTKIAEKMGLKFSLRSQAVSHAETFSPTGALPAIAKRADQLSSLCLGYGIGANFTEEQGTLVGKRVTFDDSTPDALRLLCMLDVLFELKKNTSSSGLTPLDELVFD